MSTSSESTTIQDHKQERILRVADACFEMFTIQELKRPIAILHEIALSFPEASGSEIQEAINLAINWRRALRKVGGWIN